MIKEPFIVNLEDLTEQEELFPNIEEQTRVASQLIEKSAKSRKALIFLQTTDKRKYFPATIEKNENIWRITPAVMLHGVRNETTGESYTDLQRILKMGFKSPTNRTNTVIADYDPSGLYNKVCVSKRIGTYASLGRPSMSSFTFGDYYLLEIFQAILGSDEQLPPPRLLTGDLRQVHSVRRAHKKDMDLCIKLRHTYREHLLDTVRFYEANKGNILVKYL